MQGSRDLTKIIRDPFERCKRFTNLIFLNSKTLSSFPKWKAATNRNIIRVNVENINKDTWDLTVNNPNIVEVVDTRTPKEIISEIIDK